MKSFVVVPDGLDSSCLNHETAHVSWVYQTILDEILRQFSEGDAIFLAPANNFGQSLTEHEAAEKYLKERNPNLRIICPEVQASGYIDTRGNAIELKKYLIQENLWPLDNVFLYSYVRHAKRAAMIFEQEGYNFVLCKVRSSLTISKRPIVHRLWYYNYPALHFFYELLASFLFRAHLK